jgi:hypothetical protein
MINNSMMKFFVVTIQDQEVFASSYKMAFLPRKITTNANSSHECTPEKGSGYLARESADVPGH